MDDSPHGTLRPRAYAKLQSVALDLQHAMIRPSQSRAAVIWSLVRQRLFGVKR